MKILVADSDQNARGIVKRVLAQHMPVAHMVEAKDGLQALDLVEQEDPDILIADVQLSMLDGMELVEAIRQSVQFRELPIICTSSSASRDDLSRLAKLGIAHFLLKPFKPAHLAERLNQVVLATATWKASRKPSAPDDKPIENLVLVIDPDANFCAFVRSLLEPELDVIEVGTGAEALRTFQDNPRKPAIVLVAEGLRVIDEYKVAKVLGRLAQEGGARAPAVILVSAAASVAPDVAAQFAQVVQRSFVPSTFLAPLQKFLPGTGFVSERLREHLRSGASTWLASAVRQTLGVLSGDEGVMIAPPGQALTDGVRSAIALDAPQSGCALRVEISCATAEANTIAAAILRRASTEAETADVFGELVNTIAGRVKASLLPLAIEWALGLPTVETLASGSEGRPYDASVWIKTSRGESVLTGISMTTSAAIPAAGKTAAPPTPGAPSAGADADLAGVLL